MGSVKSGRLISSLSAVVVSFLVASCLSNGFERRYTAIPGKAVIVEVVQADYNPCGDSLFLNVFYDFIPDDPEAPSRYLHTGFTDSHLMLFVENRGDIYKPWVEEMGIKPGKVYEAVRYEKVKKFGSHPPVYMDVKIVK